MLISVLKSLLLIYPYPNTRYGEDNNQISSGRTNYDNLQTEHFKKLEKVGPTLTSVNPSPFMVLELMILVVGLKWKFEWLCTLNLLQVTVLLNEQLEFNFL